MLTEFWVEISECSLQEYDNSILFYYLINLVKIHAGKLYMKNSLFLFLNVNENISKLIILYLVFSLRNEGKRDFNLTLRSSLAVNSNIL